MNEQIALHSPLNSFWWPILVEENPPFGQILPFGPVFNQLVACITGVIYFFFSRFCRRAKASAKWLRSARQLQARRGRRRKSNSLSTYHCFVAFRPRHTPYGAPHSVRACIHSPEKRTPVMQASQLAWYGNGWKRDLQHKTAKLDVH